jgi:hypothetical protein
LPTPKQLESLVYIVPDPAADRDVLLELRDPAGAAARRLAERLHTESEWRNSPLRELLPGLSLIDAPNFSIQLSVRAANPILRVGAGTLKGLAGMTPAAILALPRIGEKTAEEVLATAVSEWASAYLDEDGEDRARYRSGEEATLPMRNVDRAQHDLADAFATIERAIGFKAFRRRQLDSDDSPTQAKVGADLGIPSERVSHYEKTIRGMLSKQMRDKESPFSIAAEYLRDRLAPLARPHDLTEALSAIDPAERALPQTMPQRCSLLLQLAGLRLSAEWVVDVEIEGIIAALLKGVTETGSADLAALERQLTRLGVRDDLRLPWIVDQPGFQVADGRLARIDDLDEDETTRGSLDRAEKMPSSSPSRTI